MKKRIVCFGDSNTWGANGEDFTRFDEDTRWTAVAQSALGDGYAMLEEGLNGRTTALDDPFGEGLSGLFYLAPCLMSQQPIDLLIVMLGTNDTKQRFSVTSENIVMGIECILEKARSLPIWRGTARPILLIAPVTIDEKYAASACGGTMGAGCAEKSRRLPPLLASCAALHDCAFLDCNDYAGVNTTDYMHIDAAGHRALGAAVAGQVRALLG